MSFPAASANACSSAAASCRSRPGDAPGRTQHVLDLRHQIELCQLLRRLSRERGIAILMASHDLNLAAAFADRLALLDQGQLVADGSPTDVLDPTLLSRVYGLHLRRIDTPLWRPTVLPDIK